MAPQMERRAPPFDPAAWAPVVAQELGAPNLTRLVEDVLRAFARVYVEGKEPEDVLGKEY